MLILSRYLLKTTAWTTMIVTLVLTLVIWLTQSLRLLDFIINGGAPISLFGSMLLLTVPKFLEVIMPVSLALGIIYSLNKFSGDSELVVMQNVGASPVRLGTGIFAFSLFIALFMLALSGWITPKANRELTELRGIVKSDYSLGLLRPGVFNVVGNDTTIYIADRSNLEDLTGIFIHFTKKGEPPTTITAQHGGLMTKDKKPYLVVFDGMRQQFNNRTGTAETLRFERYSVDLTSLIGSNAAVYDDPSDRNLDVLLRQRFDGATDHLISAEIHSRFSKPLLTLAFALLATVPYLVGHYNRRGQSVRVTTTIVSVLVLQCIYLGAVNMIDKNMAGLLALYGIPLATIIVLVMVLLDKKSLAVVEWLKGGKERLI